MEEIIKQAINQDPRALYLQQLGCTIHELCKKHNGYFYSDEYDLKIKIQLVDSLHNKAMQVINTLPKENATN